MNSKSPSTLSTVRVTTGTYRSNLENQFKDEIRRLKDHDPLTPVVVLAGSALLNEYLRWRLLFEKINSLNIHFLSFQKLAHTLYFHLHPDKTRPVLPAGGNLAISNVALNNSDTSNNFTVLQSKPGFLRSLCSSFEDMDDAGLKNIPDDLPLNLNLRRLQDFKQSRNVFNKLQDEFLRMSDLMQASTAISTGFREAFETDHLIIYGIYDLNGSQRAYLKALQKSISLSVYLPCTSDNHQIAQSFRYAESTRIFWLELSDKYSVELNIKGSSVLENDSIAGRLFNYAPVEVGKSVKSFEGRFVVSDPLNPLDEVKQIVGKICELVFQDEIDPAKINILLWNPNQYREILCRELRKTEIPFCDLAGCSVADSAEAGVLLRLLHLSIENLSRKDIADLIAGTAMRIGNVSKENETPDRAAFEAITIETGIVEKSIEGWMQSLAEIKSITIDQYENSSLHPFVTPSQVELFVTFLEKLSSCLKLLSSSDNWTDLVHATVHLCAEFLPESEISSKIIEVINELSTLSIVVQKAELNNFVETVKSALKSTIIREGRYYTDGILICDKMTARGLSCEYVFIPGMIHGSVPVSYREDPLIRDRDRETINEHIAGDKAFPMSLRAKRIDEELLLFALWSESASVMTYLTYPQKQLDNSANYPSHFLLELCRIVSKKTVSSDNLRKLPIYHAPTTEKTNRVQVTNESSEDLSFERTLYDANSYLQHWISCNISPDEKPKVLRQLYSNQVSAFDRIIDVRKARRYGDKFSSWDGILRHSWRNIDEDQYNITQFEAFSNCPFRSYLKSQLMLSKWEEPENLFHESPLDTGSIVHQVLDNFFTKFAHKLPLTPSDFDWACNEIFSSLSDRLAATPLKSQLPQYTWKMFTDSLKMRLAGLVKYECELVSDGMPLLATEKRVSQDFTFGEHGRQRKVTLKGRIDRIDLDENAGKLRIVDYKTGSKPAKKFSLDGGRRLQLPLYLRLILDEHPHLDSDKAEALYLHINHDGRISALSEINGNKLNELTDDLEMMVRNISSCHTRGLFPPLGSKSACRFCDVISACDNFSRWASERRLDDPLITEIRQVRSVK